MPDFTDGGCARGRTRIASVQPRLGEVRFLAGDDRREIVRLPAVDEVLAVKVAYRAPQLAQQLKTERDATGQRERIAGTRASAASAIVSSGSYIASSIQPAATRLGVAIAAWV